MNIIEHLGIKTESVKKQRVILSLTISEFHLQPFGIVHGGINGLLIETACSLGANTHLTFDQHALGIELSVHHLASASSGKLKVIAEPINIGRTIQLWEASVFLDEQKKVAYGTCTLYSKV